MITGGQPAEAHLHAEILFPRSPDPHLRSPSFQLPSPISIHPLTAGYAI